MGIHLNNNLTRATSKYILNFNSSAATEFRILASISKDLSKMLRNLIVLVLIVPSSICFGQIQTVEMDAINQNWIPLRWSKPNL